MVLWIWAEWREHTSSRGAERCFGSKLRPCASCEQNHIACTPHYSNVLPSCIGWLRMSCDGVWRCSESARRRAALRDACTRRCGQARRAAISISPLLATAASARYLYLWSFFCVYHVLRARTRAHGGQMWCSNTMHSQLHITGKIPGKRSPAGPIQLETSPNHVIRTRDACRPRARKFCVSHIPRAQYAFVRCTY